MESVPKKEIEEIAMLARLHLEPDEIETLSKELGTILEHFAQIAAVDTTGIAPMTHAVPLELRLREDVPEPSLPAQEALMAAPRRDGDLFLVPAIIPGSEP